MYYTSTTKFHKKDYTWGIVITTPSVVICICRNRERTPTIKTDCRGSFVLFDFLRQKLLKIKLKITENIIGKMCFIFYTYYIADELNLNSIILAIISNIVVGVHQNTQVLFTPSPRYAKFYLELLLSMSSSTAITLKF